MRKMLRYGRVAGPLALAVTAAVGLGSAASAGLAAPKPFVYAEAFSFSTMDPATAGLNPDMLVTQNTYDALTRYDESRADAHPAGAAPTSWTRKGTVWTFKLRTGVKFHNGAAFSATDVKASIDRMMKIGQGLAYLLYNVKSVAVVNPTTVKITAKTANPWLPANLVKVGIVSAADIKSHATGGDLAQGWFKDHENGTGAYKVQSNTPGTQLVLARNKGWFGKFSAHPVDTFIDRFVVDGTQRFIGLKGGDYQLAAFISTDNALSLDKKKFHLAIGNNLWAYPNLNFSLTQEPTKNADFRAALVAAFDYKAMVAYYKGYASTSNGPIPGWVPGLAERLAAEDPAGPGQGQVAAEAVRHVEDPRSSASSRPARPTTRSWARCCRPPRPRSASRSSCGRCRWPRSPSS